MSTENGLKGSEGNLADT